MLICYCGIDGTGKTTQVKLTKNWLSRLGYSVHMVNISDTEIARKICYRIRSKSKIYCNLHSLASAFDYFCGLVLTLMPALHNYEVVLCDRYVYCQAVYSRAFGASSRWSEILLRKLAPEPDVIFLIDAPAEIVLRRIKSKKSHENLQILRKARKIYLTIADSSFIKVDGKKGIEDIHKDIKAYLSRFLRKNTKKRESID